MADPETYDRSYSFAGYQASNPSAPLPGAQVDNELSNIADSLNGAVDAIKDVRRADGALQNAIVTFDALAPEVAAGVGPGALDTLAQAATAADTAIAQAVIATTEAGVATAAAASASGYVGQLTGTSTTSVAIATGLKAFTTQAGKLFNNQFVLLTSAANNANFMYGLATYSGTALSVNVTVIGGSGTKADWNIVICGAPGPQGAAGGAGAGTGDMLAANNLNDVANKNTARTNLALGSGDTVTHNALALNANSAQIVLDADGSFPSTLSSVTRTAARVWTLPDKTGTVAMTSDIPSVGTAAAANTGTGAGNVIVLDGSAHLPAVDASNLTNVPVLPRGYASYTANADITSVIPADNSIPQITEGTEILSVTITPTSATARVRIRAVGIWGAPSGGNNYLVAALFDGVANALAASAVTINASTGVFDGPTLEFEHVPGVTSPVTYSVRVGPGLAGTIRLNGSATGRLFGGVSGASLTVEQVTN